MSSPDEFTPAKIEPLSDARSKAEAARRMSDVTSTVDAAIRNAQARGEFDNLPGAGKPIKGLDGAHDPDWWLKQLVERERLVVLPPSVQLRKDDAALDDLLDGLHAADAVRAAVEEFNGRVIAARYSLPAGPPLITMPRDVEAEVSAWQERREARRANGAAAADEANDAPRRSRLSRLFRRGAANS